LKYAVVILVVLLGVWLWRKNRSDAKQDAPPTVRKASPQPNLPQIMVSCAVCGVHLPQNESLQGKKNHYCSLAHRQKLEG
jgi:uncharacterized protein